MIAGELAPQRTERLRVWYVPSRALGRKAHQRASPDTGACVGGGLHRGGPLLCRSGRDRDPSLRHRRSLTVLPFTAPPARSGIFGVLPLQSLIRVSDRRVLLDDPSPNKDARPQRHVRVSAERRLRPARARTAGSAGEVESMQREVAAEPEALYDIHPGLTSCPRCFPAERCHRLTGTLRPCHPGTSEHLLGRPTGRPR